MKYLFGPVFILAFITVSAQRQNRFNDENTSTMTDAFGQPIYTQKKFNWEGNVFYPENYTYASITSANGKVYKKVKAKINLLDGTILYSDSTGKDYVVVVPVKKIEFDDNALQKNAFAVIEKDTTREFYQVLDSGKISLWKKIYLSYTDHSVYGSTTQTRIFTIKESLYVNTQNSINAIEKSKQYLLKLFSDKKSLIETFLKNENLGIKKQEDLVKVFHYYNSLK